VYERFSTLNAVSNGRAEIIVGRGSFTESFPLFGFDLQKYELLFEERLDLLAALVEGKPVTWSGRTRSALENQTVYPADRSRTETQGLGRRGRDAEVGRAGGALRFPAHARDHRRQLAAVRFLRRALPPRAVRVRQAAA